jgi:transaldolase/glucose-6-phosphate isomerase
MTTKPSGWDGWRSPTSNKSPISTKSKLSPEVKKGAFSDILLLGMGGSSLCPEVLADLPADRRFPAPAHVLDSTDPAQMKRRKQNRPRENPLHRLQQVGQHARTEYLQAVFLRTRPADSRQREKAGSHFIAITDPGSKMQQVAEARSLPPHLSMDCRPLAGAIRPSRISAWFPPPPWDSIPENSSREPKW